MMTRQRDLANAIADLEQITLDTSALEHEIELAEAILTNIDDYVPSTVEGLQEKAGATRAALEATPQEEIDAAAESLREACLNARTKADVSALQALIAQVNSLDLSGYTDSSKLTLDRALIAAKRVAADEEATQDEVNLMLEQLQGAVNALEPVQESRRRRLTRTRRAPRQRTMTPQREEQIAADDADTAAEQPSYAAGAWMILAASAMLFCLRRKHS